MKNKIKLKKCLIKILICSLILLLIFLIMNVYEYKTYTKNYNDKILQIVTKIKNDYPNINDNDIMEILNSKTKDENILKKYSIDLKDSIIIENKEQFYIFTKLNILYFIFSIIILLIIFLRYNSNKDKEINEITKYIEEINKRNYHLKIDEISEDELSILKNEIYKTTVMLKESAENSLKDKKELKKSLEDISHQLKTPLTSILLMLDNLIDNQNMDINTRLDFIRDIKREITNINFLVYSILKLSRFDSNTIDFIKEKTKINNIIKEAIKNLSSLCDLKNIKIIVEGDKNIEIYCDLKWEVEALTNIIKNSIEHSKENSEIKIKYEENNIYSQITIEDFGSGISKKDISHIFERFYKSKNKSENSIGIGLSLAKSIIEKDNGTISVSSEKGAKFTIKYFKIII